MMCAARKNGLPAGGQSPAHEADRISPWLPEQDRVRLAALGKLIEECNELGARAARCIIHGLAQTDPDSGRRNCDELAREMADVVACITFIERVVGVYVDDGRTRRKLDGFVRWRALIEPAAASARPGAGASAGTAVERTQ